MPQRIRVQHLLGTKVVDSVGRRAGHIEELIAQERDGKCLVTAYMLGERGLMQRLSIADFAMGILSFLGARKAQHSRNVSWKEMDLSDPHHPRLRCTIEQLEA